VALVHDLWRLTTLHFREFALVAYGNAGWKKEGTFKGKMSAPRKAHFERMWRERRIPVYPVNEFRTSIVNLNSMGWEVG
jgi:hypothetical protein